MSKNTPVIKVTDPSLSTAESTREEALASYCWLSHTSATEKVSNTLLQSAEFFHWMSATVTETDRERKWARCLSLDTGCAGACELKYKPLLFDTVKEWQPHDSWRASHAHTQKMHWYLYQNLIQKVILFLALASFKAWPVTWVLVSSVSDNP